MKIGIIGLGKMGKGLALNLLDHKFELVAFNRSSESLEEVLAAGAIAAQSFGDVAVKLSGSEPKIIWLMLTAGAALDEVLFKDRLLEQLQPGDIIIDGGNSNYKDSVRRYNLCKERGIHFLDAGVSGGPAGARHGAAIMVGGDHQAYQKCVEIFRALSVENGFGYVGASGAGHYVKMVHNAIEYGMLQALGEGYDLLKSGAYPDLDLNNITSIWQNGTVIRGFLIDLMKKALASDPVLTTSSTYIEDNGEGKWAVESALEYGVPFAANTYALMFRYLSRQDQSFAAKVITALRHEFGGHRSNLKANAKK